jgi:hypothetical protein
MATDDKERTKVSNQMVTLSDSKRKIITLPKPMPMLLSKQRLQHQWRKSCTSADFGHIVPSDQAFVAMISEKKPRQRR